jgi:hypothetical protein
MNNVLTPTRDSQSRTAAAVNSLPLSERMEAGTPLAGDYGYGATPLERELAGRSAIDVMPV